jgi:hypothetical protein
LIPIALEKLTTTLPSLTHQPPKTVSRQYGQIYRTQKTGDYHAYNGATIETIEWAHSIPQPYRGKKIIPYTRDIGQRKQAVPEKNSTPYDRGKN